VIQFVFPNDPLSEREVEPHFRPQAAALTDVGFQCGIVADGVFTGASAPRTVMAGNTVVYRGWMVTPPEYALFSAAIEARGAQCLVSPEHYAQTHWLSNWYDKLKEYTPETVFLPKDCDLNAELRSLGWSRFFLKDFVKSLKVDGGSIVSSPEDGERWLREFLHYRDVLEGGIAVRRVEAFAPESEVRYFVVEHHAYGPDDRSIPAPVLAAAERIDSRCFTVDIAENAQGGVRIVELGDGQVSDLVGWTPVRFATICRTAWPG
jgi:hypothetical protein